jgi:hypothetical protein
MFCSCCDKVKPAPNPNFIPIYAGCNNDAGFDGESFNSDCNNSAIYSSKSETDFRDDNPRSRQTGDGRIVSRDFQSANDYYSG